jgi:hypothetical protein
LRQPPVAVRTSHSSQSLIACFNMVDASALGSIEAKIDLMTQRHEDQFSEVIAIMRTQTEALTRVDATAKKLAESISVAEQTVLNNELRQQAHNVESTGVIHKVATAIQMIEVQLKQLQESYSNKTFLRLVNARRKQPEGQQGKVPHWGQRSVGHRPPLHEHTTKHHALLQCPGLIRMVGTSHRDQT